MKNKLPFQQMPAAVPVQVIRLKDFYAASAFVPHRHDFFMLLWATKGEGRHRVQFRELALLPDRVHFMHQGQVHQMLQYPEDGWLVLFVPAVFRLFLGRYPELEQQGLFDEFGGTAYAGLDRKTAEVYGRLLPLMELAAGENPANPILADYLNILLYQAAALGHPGVQELHPLQADKLRQLKALIDTHFRQERYAPFYSEALGMVTRKLNGLALQFTGRRVHELVTARLLSEAEVLLGGTRLTIKEITYELGFIDNAHFAVFFKKQKGITASAFRRALQTGASDGTV